MPSHSPTQPARGATTGRPRRCGWFDLVAGRYAVDINGMTGVIITKLDVLDDLPAVQVAVKYELDGVEIETYPVLSEALPYIQRFGGRRPNAASRYAGLPHSAVGSTTLSTGPCPTWSPISMPRHRQIPPQAMAPPAEQHDERPQTDGELERPRGPGVAGHVNGGAPLRVSVWPG